MKVSTRFSRKKGGKIQNMLSEYPTVSFNSLMPFKEGGIVANSNQKSVLKRKDLKSVIGAPNLPSRLGPVKGRTLSRKTSEVPVRTRKVNAYNYRKGRPMNAIERMLRKEGRKTKRKCGGKMTKFSK